jgi:rhodanese-related sulfurtransferase
MAGLNAMGAGAVPVPEPVPVDGEQVARAVADGAWVIDLRTRAAYSEGHLPGTVSVEYGSQFATYVGWLAPWGGHLVLLVDDPADLVAATRDLGNIGIDGLGGHVITTDAELPRPAGYRRTDWAGFAEAGPDRVVVDVRQRDEYDAGHLPGALHIPVQDVEVRLADIPPGEVWVHCRSGYRAGVAASLLHRAGRDVVHVDDDWDRVHDLGLHLRAA